MATGTTRRVPEVRRWRGVSWRAESVRCREDTVGHEAVYRALMCSGTKPESSSCGCETPGAIQSELKSGRRLRPSDGGSWWEADGRNESLADERLGSRGQCRSRSQPQWERQFAARLETSWGWWKRDILVLGVLPTTGVVAGPVASKGRGRGLQSRTSGQKREAKSRGQTGKAADAGGKGQG